MSRSQHVTLHRGIYVMHEREFVRSGEPVYKPGRTVDIWGRLKSYPKGTRLVTFRHCAVSESKLVELETGLLAELLRNPRLRQRTEFGQGGYAPLEPPSQDPPGGGFKGGVAPLRYIEFPSMGIPLEALVTEFVGERCVLRPGALLPAPKLCEMLSAWISERHPGEPPMAHTAVMRAMKALGFERSKSALRCRGYPSAVHCFSGISMKDPHPADAVDALDARADQARQHAHAFEAFLRARLERTGDSREHVSLKGLFEDYKEFCTTEGRAADRKSGFKDTMVAALGAIVEASNGERNFWKGWRLREVVAAPRG